MLRMRSFLSFVSLISCFTCIAQAEEVYPFWKDDTLLRKNYYDQSTRKKQLFITSAGKEHAKDYKEIYESQFASINAFWKSTRPVTAPAENAYLQSIVQKIIAANPELKNTDARIVFTRDGWPNAESMGDGTIVINAGLVIFMDNEAELVFALCHELAHYYLDHSTKAIKKMVTEYNSDAFKAEMKRLSKQEYGVGHELEALMKKMAFGSRKHSRDNEAEADRQAFRFMKNTGYDCGGILSCLRMLDHVDDSSVFKPFVPESSFNFEDYSFKKKWIQKTSAIFGQMAADDSPLTRQERDSLRTHPDCEMRIRLLRDSVAHAAEGKKFLVSESKFTQLKKEFRAEIAEQEFRNDNLARNLYDGLLLLQNNEQVPLAIYSVARDLNILYQRQKEHRLGDIDKEGRSYPADYNLLLRMIDRLKLDEIAELNYNFCRRYESVMTGYAAFQAEWKKAQKNRLEHKAN
jgi:Zn-dependent protease with chaperone function